MPVIPFFVEGEEEGKIPENEYSVVGLELEMYVSQKRQKAVGEKLDLYVIHRACPEDLCCVLVGSDSPDESSKTPTILSYDESLVLCMFIMGMYGDERLFVNKGRKYAAFLGRGGTSNINLNLRCHSNVHAVMESLSGKTGIIFDYNQPTPGPVASNIKNIKLMDCSEDALGLLNKLVGDFFKSAIDNL